jgi:hypothetical protein
VSAQLGVLRLPQNVADRGGVPGILRGLAVREVTLGGVRLVGDYGSSGLVDLVPARLGKVTTPPLWCFRTRKDRRIVEELRRLEAVQARRPTL